tara:strand:- start:119 stop:403 length:285 start_codon:yes stop_codon:yes gene_type:complete
MTTKKDMENYSVSQFIKRLELEGYDNDRAVAASLDMLRRGTLPMVSPPVLSTGQKQQQKKIESPRRQVVAKNRRAAKLQQLRFRKRLRKLKRKK